MRALEDSSKQVQFSILQLAVFLGSLVVFMIRFTLSGGFLEEQIELHTVVEQASFCVASEGSLHAGSSVAVATHKWSNPFLRLDLSN